MSTYRTAHEKLFENHTVGSHKIYTELGTSVYLKTSQNRFISSGQRLLPA